MKKILTGRWFVTLMLVGLVCWGQMSLNAVELGVKFGLNRMENSSNNEFNTRLGIFCGFKIARNLVLQPEVNITRYLYPFAGVNYPEVKQIIYADNLRYLELPVVLKYRVPLKGQLRPVILAGGYLSLRISEGKPKLTNSQLSYEFWESYGTPLSRQYAGVEGGIVIGLGLEHGQGNTRMHFDVRMNIGLSDLIHVKGFSEDSTGHVKGPYDYSQRHHSLSFNFGLGF